MDVNKPRVGFFQAMFNSYSVLVNHPFAFFVFILALVCIIAEINNSYGPLELISNALLEYCESGGPLTSLARILLSIIQWIIPIKIKFFLCFLFLVPAIINCDTSTFILSITFCFLVFFANISIYKLFLFSQFYYIYTFVESAFYKFIILFFAFILLIIGYQHFSNMLGLA